MKTNHRLSMLIKAASDRYGKDKGKMIGEDALSVFSAFCREYEDDPKPVKKHTEKEVFPTVAVQKALEKNGIPREEASKVLADAIWKETEGSAKWMTLGIKVTGIYKKVPKMFISSLESGFSKDMGFDYKIYDTGKNRGKFDMLKCPYHDYFTRLGYPELTDIFCTNDDIEDGRMHPKLIWARTKTLGRGGDCCDFDIYYEPEKK